MYVINFILIISTLINLSDIFSSLLLFVVAKSLFVSFLAFYDF